MRGILLFCFFILSRAIFWEKRRLLEQFLYKLSRNLWQIRSIHQCVYLIDKEESADDADVNDSIDVSESTLNESEESTLKTESDSTADSAANPVVEKVAPSAPAYYAQLAGFSTARQLSN